MTDVATATTWKVKPTAEPGDSDDKSCETLIMLDAKTSRWFVLRLGDSLGSLFRHPEDQSKLAWELYFPDTSRGKNAMFDSAEDCYRAVELVDAGVAAKKTASDQRPSLWLPPS